MSDSIILIPARLNSTRLKEKVLLPLGGKTVLEQVWLRCSKIKDADCVILTDSLEIERVCKDFGAKVELTSNSHNSGTERIIEYINRVGNCYENIINIQGDEPFIDSKFIDGFLKSMKKEGNYRVFTTYYKSNMASDFMDPSIVKLVKNTKNEALYFSRSAIPYGATEYFKHLGVYGYKKSFFERSYFGNNPLVSEKLEQLNFLYSGEKIFLVESAKDYLGINTIEDYHRAEKIMKTDHD